MSVLRMALIAFPPTSGYNVARMKYEIILSPEAVDDLRELKANIRAAIRDAIEEHLRHEPTKTSKSRIKRLQGLSRPQYRLRVEDPRFLQRIERARQSVRAGLGVKLEDVEI